MEAQENYEMKIERYGQEYVGKADTVRKKYIVDQCIYVYDNQIYNLSGQARQMIFSIVLDLLGRQLDTDIIEYLQVMINSEIELHKQVNQKHTFNSQNMHQLLELVINLQQREHPALLSILSTATEYIVKCRSLSVYCSKEDLEKLYVNCCTNEQIEFFIAIVDQQAEVDAEMVRHIVKISMERITVGNYILLLQLINMMLWRRNLINADFLDQLYGTEFDYYQVSKFAMIQSDSDAGVMVLTEFVAHIGVYSAKYGFANQFSTIVYQVFQPLQFCDSQTMMLHFSAKEAFVWNVIKTLRNQQNRVTTSTYLFKAMQIVFRYLVGTQQLIKFPMKDSDIELHCNICKCICEIISQQLACKTDCIGLAAVRLCEQYILIVIRQFVGYYTRLCEIQDYNERLFIFTQVVEFHQSINELIVSNIMIQEQQLLVLIYDFNLIKSMGEIVLEQVISALNDLNMSQRLAVTQAKYKNDREKQLEELYIQAIGILEQPNSFDLFYQPIIDLMCSGSHELYFQVVNSLVSSAMRHSFNKIDQVVPLNELNKAYTSANNPYILKPFANARRISLEMDKAKIYGMASEFLKCTPKTMCTKVGDGRDAQNILYMLMNLHYYQPPDKSLINSKMVNQYIINLIAVLNKQRLVDDGYAREVLLPLVNEHVQRIAYEYNYNTTQLQEMLNMTAKGLRADTFDETLPQTVQDLTTRLQFKQGHVQLSFETVFFLLLYYPVDDCTIFLPHLIRFLIIALNRGHLFTRALAAQLWGGSMMFTNQHGLTSNNYRRLLRDVNYILGSGHTAAVQEVMEQCEANVLLYDVCINDLNSMHTKVRFIKQHDKSENQQAVINQEIRITQRDVPVRLNLQKLILMYDSNDYDIYNNFLSSCTLPVNLTWVGFNELQIKSHLQLRAMQMQFQAEFMNTDCPTNFKHIADGCMQILGLYQDRINQRIADSVRIRSISSYSDYERSMGPQMTFWNLNFAGSECVPIKYSHIMYHMVIWLQEQPTYNLNFDRYNQNSFDQQIIMRISKFTTGVWQILQKAYADNKDDRKNIDIKLLVACSLHLQSFKDKSNIFMQLLSVVHANHQTIKLMYRIIKTLLLVVSERQYGQVFKFSNIEGHVLFYICKIVETQPNLDPNKVVRMILLAALSNPHNVFLFVKITNILLQVSRRALHDRQYSIELTSQQCDSVLRNLFTIMDIIEGMYGEFMKQYIKLCVLQLLNYIYEKCGNTIMLQDRLLRCCNQFTLTRSNYVLYDYLIMIIMKQQQDILPHVVQQLLARQTQQQQLLLLQILVFNNALAARTVSQYVGQIASSKTTGFIIACHLFEGDQWKQLSEEQQDLIYQAHIKAGDLTALKLQYLCDKKLASSRCQCGNISCAAEHPEPLCPMQARSALIHIAQARELPQQCEFSAMLVRWQLIGVQVAASVNMSQLAQKLVRSQRAAEALVLLTIWETEDVKLVESVLRGLVKGKKQHAQLVLYDEQVLQLLNRFRSIHADLLVQIYKLYDFCGSVVTWPKQRVALDSNYYGSIFALHDYMYTYVDDPSIISMAEQQLKFISTFQQHRYLQQHCFQKVSITEGPLTPVCLRDVIACSRITTSQAIERAIKHQVSNSIINDFSEQITLDVIRAMESRQVQAYIIVRLIICGQDHTCDWLFDALGSLFALCDQVEDIGLMNYIDHHLVEFMSKTQHTGLSQYSLPNYCALPQTYEYMLSSMYIGKNVYVKQIAINTLSNQTLAKLHISILYNKLLRLQQCITASMIKLFNVNTAQSQYNTDVEHILQLKTIMYASGEVSRLDEVTQMVRDLTAYMLQFSHVCRILSSHEPKLSSLEINYHIRPVVIYALHQPTQLIEVACNLYNNKLINDYTSSMLGYYQWLGKMFFGARTDSERAKVDTISIIQVANQNKLIQDTLTNADFFLPVSSKQNVRNNRWQSNQDMFIEQLQQIINHNVQTSAVIQDEVLSVQCYDKENGKIIEQTFAQLRLNSSNNFLLFEMQLYKNIPLQNLVYSPYLYIGLQSILLHSITILVSSERLVPQESITVHMHQMLQECTETVYQWHLISSAFLRDTNSIRLFEYYVYEIYKGIAHANLIGCNMTFNTRIYINEALHIQMLDQAIMQDLMKYKEQIAGQVEFGQNPLFGYYPLSNNAHDLYPLSLPNECHCFELIHALPTITDGQYLSYPFMQLLVMKVLRVCHRKIDILENIQLLDDLLRISSDLATVLYHDLVLATYARDKMYSYLNFNGIKQLKQPYLEALVSNNNIQYIFQQRFCRRLFSVQKSILNVLLFGDINYNFQRNTAFRVITDTMARVDNIQQFDVYFNLLLADQCQTVQTSQFSSELSKQQLISGFKYYMKQQSPAKFFRPNIQQEFDVVHWKSSMNGYYECCYQNSLETYNNYAYYLLLQKMQSTGTLHHNFSREYDRNLEPVKRINEILGEVYAQKIDYRYRLDQVFDKSAFPIIQCILERKMVKMGFEEHYYGHTVAMLYQLVAIIHYVLQQIQRQILKTDLDRVPLPFRQTYALYVRQLQRIQQRNDILAQANSKLLQELRGQKAWSQKFGDEQQTYYELLVAQYSAERRCSKHKEDKRARPQTPKELRHIMKEIQRNDRHILDNKRLCQQIFEQYVGQVIVDQRGQIYSEEHKILIANCALYARLFEMCTDSLKLDNDELEVISVKMSDQIVQQQIMREYCMQIKDFKTLLGYNMARFYQYAANGNLYATTPNGKILYHMNVQDTNEGCNNAMLLSKNPQLRVSKAPPAQQPFIRHMCTYKNFSQRYDIMFHVHQYLLRQTYQANALTNAQFYQLIDSGQECLQKLTQNVFMPLTQRQLINQAQEYIEDELWRLLRAYTRMGYLNNPRAQFSPDPIHVSLTSINTNNERVKQVVHIIDLDRSNQFKRQHRMFWQQLLVTNNFTIVEKLSLEVRDIYLKAHMQDGEPFSNTTEQMEKCLAQIGAYGDQIINSVVSNNTIHNISFEQYLQQITQYVKNIVSHKQAAQHDTWRDQDDVVSGSCLSQMVATLNSLCPGNCKYLHNAYISNLAIFYNILHFWLLRGRDGEAGAAMDILCNKIQYQPNTLDFEDKYDVSEMRKLMECYACVALGEPDLVMQQVIFNGVIKRCVGKSILQLYGESYKACKKDICVIGTPQAERSRSPALNYTTGGDVGNFIILSQFYISQYEPSSVAPGIHNLLNNPAFTDMLAINNQQYIRVIDDIGKAARQGISAPAVLCEEVDNEFYMLTYRPELIVYNIVLLYQEYHNNMALISKYVMLLQLMIPLQQNRNSVVYEEYKAIYLEVSTLNSYCEQIYNSIRNGHSITQSLQLLHEYATQCQNATGVLCLDSQKVNLVAAIRLCMLTALQKMVLELDFVVGTRQDKQLMWDTAIRPHVLYTRLQVVTAIMQHLVYTKCDFAAALNMAEGVIGADRVGEALGGAGAGAAALFLQTRAVALASANRLRDALDAIAGCEGPGCWGPGVACVRAAVCEALAAPAGGAGRAPAGHCYCLYASCRRSLGGCPRGRGAPRAAGAGEPGSGARGMAVCMLNSLFKLSSRPRRHDGAAHSSGGGTNLAVVMFGKLLGHLLLQTAHRTAPLWPDSGSPLHKTPQELDTPRRYPGPAPQDNLLAYYLKCIPSLAREAIVGHLDTIVNTMACDQSVSVFMVAFMTGLVLRLLKRSTKQHYKSDSFGTGELTVDSEQILSMLLAHAQKGNIVSPHEFTSEWMSEQRVLGLLSSHYRVDTQRQSVGNVVRLFIAAFKVAPRPPDLAKLAYEIQHAEITGIAVNFLFMGIAVRAASAVARGSLSLGHFIDGIHVPDIVWVRQIITNMRTAKIAQEQCDQCMEEVSAFFYKHYNINVTTLAEMQALSAEFTTAAMHLPYDLSMRLYAAAVQANGQIYNHYEQQNPGFVYLEGYSPSAGTTSDGGAAVQHYVRYYKLASRSAAIHCIDGVPFLQLNLLDPMCPCNRLTALITNGPSSDMLDEIPCARSILEYTDFNKIYLYNRAYRLIQNAFSSDMQLFKQEHAVVDQRIINGQYILLYKSHNGHNLSLKILGQVKIDDFTDLNHFRLFKENLAAEIADMMLFHQLLGCSKQVTVSDKTVDMVTGKFISASQFTWALPAFNRHVHMQYLQYAVYCAELLGGKTITQTGDQEARHMLRVTIDPLVVRLLTPEFLIGHVSCQLGRKARSLIKNYHYKLQRYLLYMPIYDQPCKHRLGGLVADYKDILQDILLPVVLEVVNQGDAPPRDRDNRRTQIIMACDVMIMALAPLMEDGELQQPTKDVNEEEGFNPAIEWVVSSINSYYE